MEQIILIITVALFLACGFWVRRSDRFSTFRDYALSKRGQGWIFIVAGISMTFVGGAATLNMAGLGYQFSWWSLVDPCAVFLGTLAAAIFINSYRQGLGITIADLLSGADLRLSLLTGIITLIVYMMLVAAQFVALSKLLAPYFSEVSPALFTVLLSATVFSYVLVNGLMSVTQTDLLQYLLVTGLLVPPIVWVALTASPTDVTPVAQGVMPLDLFILLGFSVLFVPMSQDVVIRAKAARTPKDARIGFIVGGLSYFLIVAACIYSGYYLARSGIVLADPERALPLFFATYYPGIGVIAIVAVFAAIASTLDSWAFATIVSCANDVLKRIPGFRQKSDRTRVFWSSGLVYVVALAIALYYNKILTLILTGLLIYVAILLPLAIGNALRVRSTALFLTSLATILSICVVEIAAIPVAPKASQTYMKY
jgi:Na+/proline symporter